MDTARANRAANRNLRFEMLRTDSPARQVHDHRLDFDLRHPLRGVNGLTDRRLCGFEIDDRATLETEGTLMTDPDDASEMRATPQ